MTVVKPFESEQQNAGSLAPAHASTSRYIEGEVLCDPYSEESGNEENSLDDEDVDDSVKEDMKKLEDTFPGISDQFRLVNRIGEGIVNSLDSIIVVLIVLLLIGNRLFIYRDVLNCLQSRRFEI